MLKQYFCAVSFTVFAISCNAVDHPPTETPHAHQPTQDPSPSPVTPTLIPTLTPPASPTPFGGGTGRIAFLWVGTSLHDFVVTMNIDGSDEFFVTQPFTDYIIYQGLAWAPDGKKLAFSGVRPNPKFDPYYSVYDVFIIDADGTNEKRLTESPNTITNHLPTFSPDGTKIAFISDRDGNAEIYTMNIDGSDAINISRTPDISEEYPAWSPDGTKIAFIANDDIFVMQADGTKPVNLTNSSALEFHPAWSPDSQKIAFSSRMNSPTNCIDIWIMNVGGSQMTNLTKIICDVNRPAEIADQPAWSPDGHWILFYGNRDDMDHVADNFEIYLINVDGTNRSRITNRVGDDVWPTWQP